MLVIAPLPAPLLCASARLGANRWTHNAESGSHDILILFLIQNFTGIAVNFNKDAVRLLRPQFRKQISPFD